MTLQRLQRVLCPEPARRPRGARALNIAFRTAHLAATGILLGGHVFGAPADAVRPFLYGAIASGTGLLAIDSYKSLDWVHQGWGILLLVKLVLICLVPFAWDLRVPLLLAVVVIASVESHMPARFRHYSMLYRRVQKA